MARGRRIRITGGALRGRTVEVPPGLAVRPMRSRLRESLFQQLGDLAGARMLDVFAGSGAIACEALSRGAGQATLVEKSRAVLRVLTRTVAELQLTARASIVNGDAYLLDIGSPTGSTTTAIAAQPLTGRFELIVLDPPFPHFGDERQDPWKLAARLVTHALTPGGALVIEHPAELDSPELDDVIVRSRRYGESCLTFFELPSS